MLVYSLILILGLALGLRWGHQPTLLQGTRKAVHACVLALLFLIGLSLSSEQQVRVQVPRLGLQALTFAVATVGAAVMLGWAGERWLRKD